MNQCYVEGWEFIFVYLAGPDNQLYVFMHFSVCLCVVLTSGERWITNAMRLYLCHLQKYIY